MTTEAPTLRQRERKADPVPSRRERLPRVVTYAEAEELLRVSRTTLRRLIAQERLEVVNVTPGTRRILLASIERYLRDRRAWADEE